MNLDFAQIAAFLDVVKDPVKYEQVLKQFEEREVRWKELVEAHTKLSNLDKYVKAAEKKALDLEKQAQAIEKEAEAKKDKMLAYYQEMVKEEEARKLETAKAETKAKNDLQEVEKLKADLKRILAENESDRIMLLSARSEVELLKQQLQEKLTKLKALAA